MATCTCTYTKPQHPKQKTLSDTHQDQLNKQKYTHTIKQNRHHHQQTQEAYTTSTRYTT